MPANEKLVLALPNGRILSEVMPLLRRAGIAPEPEFDNPATRQLRFATSDPDLDIIRTRSFDVATFVAFGAAQIGVAGNDVLMEFGYPELYAPLDLKIGDIRKYMSPEEFRALISPPDERDTVIVKADAPQVPMKTPLDVPGGILAPFWALAHPTQAWRLFLPDPRIDINEIPPPESKVPPPVFRWGP